MAQIVLKVKGTIESCVRAGDSQKHVYELKIHKIHGYELRSHEQEIHAYELKIRKSCAEELKK